MKDSALYADVQATRYRRTLVLSGELEADRIDANLKNSQPRACIPKPTGPPTELSQPLRRETQTRNLTELRGACFRFCTGSALPTDGADALLSVHSSQLRGPGVMDVRR